MGHIKGDSTFLNYFLSGPKLKKKKFIVTTWPDVVAHAFDISTVEAEVGESL